MAQFTHSLCEEVIRTDGACGLTRNEMVQMAWLALRALKNENPLLADAIRYRWLRKQHWDHSAMAVVSDPKENVRLGTYCPSDDRLDAAIDEAMRLDI
jgi:hypothetical protein